MELYHKEEFPDVEEIVVPIENRGRTEENKAIMQWVAENERIPLYFQREDMKTVHFECSKLFDAKIKLALEHREAVGKDGKVYVFTSEDEFPDNLTSMGGSICIRAAVKGSGNYREWYSTDFFV